MDLRKVQLTGGSSITVTLPKAWVGKARIRAGDVVGCSEQPDGSLAIHPHVRGDRALQSYDVEINESEGDEYLFRKIIAAYLMGFDAIAIKSNKPVSASSRLTIRRAVRRIIGLEIVEESPNAMTVQDFLDPREFHVDKALRRMIMLTQAMQEEAISLVKSPEDDLLRSVEERDDEVDRLYWLVSKQFHAMLRDVSYAAKMDLTPTQALNFLLVARLVERTADHADRIAVQALELPREGMPEPFLKRLEANGRAANDLFRRALSMFFRKDARKADALIDETTEFLKTQGPLLKEAAALGGETVVHLAYIIESIGRTAAYAADVGEITINHKVASTPP